jgi:TRAP-type transport system periplasmic protein
MSVTTTLTRLLAAGVTAALLGTAAFAQDVTLKLGHLGNEQNIWHKASR